MITQVAYFISLATSAILFAFQQAGYVQDSSFSLFQAVDVNHDAMILPRLSLFKYVMSETYFDQKSSQFSRCQMHDSIFFIEYVEGYPVPEVDTCLNITPILLHLAAPGGEDSFHDDLLARSDRTASADGSADKADAAFRKLIDATLNKISRCIAINTLTRTLTLINGKGLGRTGDAPRKDVVPWYIGTDETYGHLILGTKYIPYSPIVNNRVDSNDSSIEFPFFLEPIYLPAGSIVALDAALFAPMDRLAEFFNSHSADDVHTGSTKDIGSNVNSFNFSIERVKDAAETVSHNREKGSLDDNAQQGRKPKAPRSWQLMHDNSAYDSNAKQSSNLSERIYSAAGGGIRDKHWIEMCSSLASALQPSLLMRSARDSTPIDAHYFEDAKYSHPYLSRPFVLTTGTDLTAGSSAGRLGYWLNLCGLHPPHINVLGQARGAQSYWFEQRRVKGQRRARSRRGSAANESLASVEARIYTKAPHQYTSPYASQAPCDVDSVQNLRTFSAFIGMNRTADIAMGEEANLERRASGLLCVEDALTHKHLVRTMYEFGGERADAVSDRLPSDWTYYASGRGLADLWYTDPALGKAFSLSESPYASREDYYLLRELQLFELRYERLRREKRSSEGRSVDGMDRATGTGSPEPSLPSEHSPEELAEAVNGHIFSNGGISSLLQARQSEYTELLRVLRAFANAHMHATDEHVQAQLRRRMDAAPEVVLKADRTHVNIKADAFLAGSIIDQTHFLKSVPSVMPGPQGAAYSTRLFIRSLFRDLLSTAVGLARAPSPALIYNSKPMEPLPPLRHKVNSHLQETRVGRKSMSKYPGKVCDLYSALLIDVPLRKLHVSINGTQRDIHWNVLPVIKSHNPYTTECAPPTSPENIGAAPFPADCKECKPRSSVSVAYKHNLKHRLRSALSVEAYFGDALREIISVSGSEPQWVFEDVLYGRLGELLPPLLASPVMPHSARLRAYSMLYTNTTHRLHTKMLYGQKPYQMCGFTEYIDERDYTLVALSLQAAVRKYLIPIWKESRHKTIHPDKNAFAEIRRSYICHFPAHAGEKSESQFLQNLFHKDTSANEGSLKHTYLCGRNSSAAAAMLLEVLSLYHEALNTTTQRAVDVHQQDRAKGAKPFIVEDPLHSALLASSTHAPAIAALGAALQELRIAMISGELDLREDEPSLDPAAVSAEADAARALNIRTTYGAVHVLLYVLPKHFSLAQELVERWRKMCASDTCHIYINYHIEMIPVDGGRASGVHRDYQEENILQLEHYLNESGDQETRSPYRFDESSHASFLLNYDEDAEEEDEGSLQSDQTKSGKHAASVSIQRMKFDNQVDTSTDKKSAAHASDTPRAEDTSLYGFETEFMSNKTRNDKPSLRMALLSASNTLRKSAIKMDVSFLCIGIEDCLGMEPLGTASNTVVPAAEYSKSDAYNLSAPIVMGISDGQLNPYSIAGKVSAINRLLHDMSFFEVNYLYGNNHDVATALVSYAKRHSFIKLYDHRVASTQRLHEDYYWVAADAKERVFSASRGLRLWSAIQSPDAIFAAKKVHMRANIVNMQNQNNQFPDVVDVLDSSNNVILGNDNIIFNVTHCSIRTFLDKRGPLEQVYSDHPWEIMSQQAHESHIWLPHAALASHELTPSDWREAAAQRMACEAVKARLLIVTALDDYTGAGNGTYASKLMSDGTTAVNGVPGNTNPGIFPWTANGSKLGYQSVQDEIALSTGAIMPLGLFPGNVYEKDRDVIPRLPGNFSGPMRHKAQDSSRFLTVVRGLAELLISGKVHALATVTMQLNRALQITWDNVHGDYDIQDAVLLKLFEGSLNGKRHGQYTPLVSYRRAIMILHDALYFHYTFDHHGRDPFHANDEEASAALRSSFTLDTESPKFEPGHAVAGMGVRGSSFASRAASSTNDMCDSIFYPLLCKPLLPGQGRGPIPMTDIGTSEYGTSADDQSDVETAQRRGENIFLSTSSEDPSQYYVSFINRAGREVFGNIISAGVYTFLSSLYAIQGPHSAMASAYAKSIAHTDYAAVSNRRKLWLKQRQQLRLQDHHYEEVAPAVAGAGPHSRRIREYNTAAGKPVVHWITMADRRNDRLHNLMFTANLAGIQLNVAGLKNEESSTASSTESFNYADKVKAFHEYLELHGKKQGQSIDHSAHSSGSIHDNDLVVLIDAYDVLLLPHARQLGQRFQETAQHPIVFCVEHGIYPEYPSAFVYQRGDAYDATFSEQIDSNNKYTKDTDPAFGPKFLNSGCVIGRAGQMRAMVHAAYINREAFRNDQQFYVRYHLSYPDLVGLDYSQRLFFTGHLQLTCQSLLTLDNDMSLKYQIHSNKLSFNFSGAENETIFSVHDIGVFHGNNMNANRQYNLVTIALNRLVMLHLMGPDSASLLSLMRACVDGDWNHAAYLLVTSSVYSNSTSHGGTNILSDFLTAKYAQQLEPALIRLAKSTYVASISDRPPYSDMAAREAAATMIKHAQMTWNQHLVNERSIILTKRSLHQHQQNVDLIQGSSEELFGAAGSQFSRAQLEFGLFARRHYDQCFG